MKFILVLFFFQLPFRLHTVSLYTVPGPPVCHLGCGPTLHCVMDNVCGCYEGYKVAKSDDLGLFYCKPLCEQPCMDNGKCVAEHICECNEGYDLVDLDCKPRCSTSCTNGYCIAPEECECYAGYKSVGNACIVILEGYIKTTPSTTTTTTTTAATKKTKITLESNYKKSGTPELSTSDFIEKESSTEEFTSSATTDTTDIVGSEITNINDDSQEMIIDNGELPIIDYSEPNEKMNETLKKYCPDDYIYYQGECRLLIRDTTHPKCNMKVCGPNSFCIQDGKCNCLPGYSWQFNAEGNAISCKSLDKKNDGLRVVPHEHNHRWISNMFTALGALCVTAAILYLLSVLYNHYK